MIFITIRACASPFSLPQPIPLHPSSMRHPSVHPSLPWSHWQQHRDTVEEEEEEEVLRQRHLWERGVKDDVDMKYIRERHRALAPPAERDNV